MVATTPQQPQKATDNQTPQKKEEAGFVQVPTAEVSPIVAKLSALREKYLEELQTAREKVKKNFLK